MKSRTLFRSATVGSTSRGSPRSRMWMSDDRAADVWLDVFFEDDVLVCAGAGDDDVDGCHFGSDVFEWYGYGVHVFGEAFGAGA